MPSAKTFQDKLKALISSRGLNPTSFAKGAKFYQSQVFRWLSGENTPSLEAIDQIAAFFGMPAASLIADGPLPEVIVVEPAPDKLCDIILQCLQFRARIGPELFDRLTALERDKVVRLLTVVNEHANIEGAVDAFLPDDSDKEKDKKP